MPIKPIDVGVIIILFVITVSLAYVSSPTSTTVNNTVHQKMVQIPVIAEGQFNNFTQAFYQLGTVIQGLPLNQLSSGIAGALFSQFSSKLGSTEIMVIENRSQISGKIVVNTTSDFGPTFKEIQSGLVLFENFTSNFSTTFGVLDGYGVAFQYLPGSTNLCISVYKGTGILYEGALQALSLPIQDEYNLSLAPAVKGFYPSGILFVNGTALKSASIHTKVNVEGEYWILTYEGQSNMSVVYTEGNYTTTTILSGYSFSHYDKGYPIYVNGQEISSFTKVKQGFWKGDTVIVFLSNSMESEIPQIMEEISN